MNNLIKKNIIVTGASGGIGNSIVKKLNEAGANILATGTRIEKLEDEIATLRNEIDVIKNAFRNELARHEVKMIKKGHDVSSIID